MNTVVEYYIQLKVAKIFSKCMDYSNEMEKIIYE